MPHPHRKLLLAVSLLMVMSPAMSEMRPTVYELFTSQGCSSCPPAEKIAGELAARPGVLVLTYHVNYWDELGWRDRFGLPDATRRQQGYAAALRSRGVYTPQAIIEGTHDVIGSNRPAIEQALLTAPSRLPVGLRVHDGRVDVDVPARQHEPAGEVVLVSYLRSAVSPIGRGENAGRTIQESNIVRNILSLGPWSGSAQTWQVRVDSLPTDATDVAVLVQERAQGAMIGAAHVALR
jgi:hypothetical protein